MTGAPGDNTVVGALLLAGLVAGHAAIALGFLSRVHAIGLNPRWMQRIPALPLLPPALIAAWLAWLASTRPVGLWPAEARAYGVLCNVIAWIVVPAAIVMRSFRKPPAGVRVRDEPLPLDPTPGGLDTWIGEGKDAWMLRLPGNESLTLRATSCELALAGLPHGFGSLRVLHLSDFHFGRCYDRRYFEAVAEAASGWAADLVVFTGDLLDDEATLDWTVPVFRRLRGRLGQFAILGNHDFAHRPGRIRRALRSAGFAMLDGRWRLVEDGRRTIALGGTSAPWGPSLVPSGRPEADATIVLSHAPDEFPRVASWGTVDVVLAGHNHGGQIRLPCVGPLVMPSRYGLRYDQGIFRRGRTLMEVTRGVGGKHPLRYGCPPEIVRLTLRPAHAVMSPLSSRPRRISDSTSRT
ncbi:MAG TPA: metallophosphoesterase [Isosphaeraceae bacterium]